MHETGLAIFRDKNTQSNGLTQRNEGGMKTGERKESLEGGEQKEWRGEWKEWRSGTEWSRRSGEVEHGTCWNPQQP